jgi:hypothetical protein
MQAVNLLRELDQAEKRPPLGFEIANREIAGVARPSLIVPVPSRLTIPLPLPRRGVLRASAALEPSSSEHSAASVRLRVGVSDDRIYERLTDVVLTPGQRGWVDVRTDLSAYAGWKWSLFYHPERMTWRVVSRQTPSMAFQLRPCGDRRDCHRLGRREGILDSAGQISIGKPSRYGCEERRVR